MGELTHREPNIEKLKAYLHFICKGEVAANLDVGQSRRPPSESVRRARQKSFDQALVLPREPGEQDDYVGVLLCQKGKLLWTQT